MKITTAVQAQSKPCLMVHKVLRLLAKGYVQLLGGVALHRACCVQTEVMSARVVLTQHIAI